MVHWGTRAKVGVSRKVSCREERAWGLPASGSRGLRGPDWAEDRSGADKKGSAGGKEVRR